MRSSILHINKKRMDLSVGDIQCLFAVVEDRLLSFGQFLAAFIRSPVVDTDDIVAVQYTIPIAILRTIIVNVFRTCTMEWSYFSIYCHILLDHINGAVLVENALQEASIFLFIEFVGWRFSRILPILWRNPERTTGPLVTLPFGEITGRAYMANAGQAIYWDRVVHALTLNI